MTGQRTEAPVLTPLAVDAPPRMFDVLAGLGRTEDLVFSPGYRRLAIAGFEHDRLYIFELDREARLTGGRVSITDCLVISSPELDHPHGLAFLDELTIIVANRTGLVTVFRLPPVGYGAGELALNPLRTLRGGWRSRIGTPGSLCARELGLGQVEVLVCNNYRNTVTRHRLDRRQDYRVGSNNVLLNAALAVPDGIATSNDGRWIAVSNHGTFRILIFENTPELGPPSRPVGELLDVDCPHGLQFNDDDRHLVVASAASPFIHVYRCNEGPEAGWQGSRHPLATIRVMDEETFLKGRINPEEGGPKGIALSGELNLLATTSEHRPLDFYDLAMLLDGARRGP